MNQAAATHELEFWKMVSEDLRIDIVTPFDVTFSDGRHLRVAALVEDFGSPRGMLIAFDYDALKPNVQKIVESGYGYSSQLGNSPAEYDRRTMISGACCFAFGNFMMYAAASLSVTSGLPFDSRIGSSNSRDHDIRQKMHLLKSITSLQLSRASSEECLAHSQHGPDRAGQERPIANGAPTIVDLRTVHIGNRHVSPGQSRQVADRTAATRTDPHKEAESGGKH
jgi:hypothetical protein